MNRLARRLIGLDANMVRLAVLLGCAGGAVLAPAELHAQTGSAANAAPAQSQPDAMDDLENLTLEDLLNVKVYAASKFTQDVAQAPASVTIVSADEIRKHAYRTLADILRSVRGFYVASDRDYSYVGVRGFLRPGDYSGRVLLLLNGHRLNDTIYEQAFLGTESPIDVSLFQRVEVIRGPSSSLYGTSAFFAVVNIVTRTGRAVNGLEIEGDAGSQKTRRGRATVGGRTAGGVEGLFSASLWDSGGNSSLYFPEFDTPPASDGRAVNADADKSAKLFASGRAGGFTAQAMYGSRTKTIPTAPFDTVFDNPHTQTIDRRGFAELQYERHLDPRTSIHLRGAYDQYDYSGDYAYGTGVFHDSAHSKWVTAEASVVRQFSRHGLTVGAEYLRNLQQDQGARDDTGVVLDDRRRSVNTALYAEDEFRISPRVIVNAGLRWDEYYGIFGSTVNPRVALIVTPVAGSAIKALYGRAFRAPNPFELYYDQNALSAQLKPERIQTYELAWEQRLGARLQASASLFRNHVRDLITQSGGSNTIDGLYYANGDDVKAEGVEVELQGELPGRVHARIAQSFQGASRDSTGARVSNSPRTLSTLVLDAPIPRTDAFIAFDAFGIGDRLRTGNGLDVPGAFVGNLSLSWRPTGKGLGVGLAFYNVFNTAYADPGSVEHVQQVIPQDGRTVSVRLAWRF